MCNQADGRLLLLLLGRQQTSGWESSQQERREKAGLNVSRPRRDAAVPPAVPPAREHACARASSHTRRVPWQHGL